MLEDDRDKTREQLIEELRARRVEADDLRARHAHLEAERDRLLERLPLGYIRIDADARVLDWNPAAESLFGYTKDEASGQGCLELIIPPPNRDHVRGVLRRLEAGDMHAHSVNENRTKDGRIIICEWFNTPLVDDDGRFAGAIVLGQDVTERRRVQEASDRDAMLLASVRDSVIITDLDGVVTYWNGGATRLFGWRAEEMVGRPLVSRVPEPARDQMAAAIRAIRDGHGFTGEWEDYRKDGSRIWIEARVSPVTDAAGNPVALLGLSYDITDRKRVEEELRTLNVALENAVEGIARLDTEGRYLSVNRAYGDMLGYEPGGLIGMDWVLTVHPRWLEKARVAYETMVKEDRAEVEALGVRKDGSVFWKQSVMVKVRSKEGRWIGHYCFMKDITDRKRAEEAQREYTARLQVLSRRVVEVQEEERRHLARELHDEVGQTLTAIGINLHSIKRHSSAAVLPQLEECIGVVDRAIRQVRLLSLDLRPPMLDDLGLVATLRWYLDRQAQRVGYRARFAAEPDEIRLEPDVATAAFRVAQESLTNVARHAGARRVRVTLRLRDGALHLVVRDDGAGFDPEATRRARARARARGEGLGLLGMRERANLLGGRVVVRSAPGRGTSVRLTVPLDRARDGA